MGVGGREGTIWEVAVKSDMMHSRSTSQIRCKALQGVRKSNDGHHQSCIVARWMERDG